MREDDFGAWLRQSYNSNTVNTQLTQARRLRDAYGDLDQLYDNDRFSELLGNLAYSKTAERALKPNPAAFPIHGDLYKNLASCRATLNYYARFRSSLSEVPTEQKPDRVAVEKTMDECDALGTQEFLNQYGFGEPSQYWVIRDDARYPSKAIYSVAFQYLPGGSPRSQGKVGGTEARQHLAKLGFKIVDASAGFTIDMVEAELTRRFGKPIKQVQYIAAWQLRDGRQIAIDRMRPPAQLWIEAGSALPPNISAKPYAPTEGRHAGLPARLNHQPPGGLSPRAVAMVRVESAQLLAELLDHYDKPSSDDRENQNTQANTMPTNLILYGPPGTGKTFATAEEAVRLCGEPVPEDRAELMASYRRLSDAGRIEFVTFHQSVSYEDFIEGLRPTRTGEDGGAGFGLKPEQGVFRRIVRRAETSTGPGNFGFALLGRQVFKMSIGDTANPDDAHLFEEAIGGGYTLLGFDDIDWSDDRFTDRSAMIEEIRAKDQKAEGLTAMTGRVQMPFIFRNWVKPGDIVVVSKGNSLFRAIGEVTGDYQFSPREGGGYSHRRAVTWLWVDQAGVPVSEIYARSFTMKSIYLLTYGDLNVPALERYVASQQDAGAGTPEPFVLIIDEINRANISKVFGELITLLEPDKRIGQANALKVRLPYSGDLFGVPSNLHVIGTMNTADRSIALLDTALRRRFEFRELLPDPSLLSVVDGVDLGKLLVMLNERVEYLFDREHQIGHAYFIGCKTRADIEEVMRHKVIPLLAEYFYEDWAKVAAVLGDAHDSEGDREGRFIDRERLSAPRGMGGDEDAAPRYRWKVRKAFSYEGSAAG
jgi:hypothetical protein